MDDEPTTEERIENAAQAMSETSRSWKHRCFAIMAALGLDFGDVDQMIADDGSPVQKFVEHMARLTTPFDAEHFSGSEREAVRKQAERDGEELTDGQVTEELVADLSNDFCFDEATAFWRLIQEARELIK